MGLVRRGKEEILGMAAAAGWELFAFACDGDEAAFTAEDRSL